MSQTTSMNANRLESAASLSTRRLPIGAELLPTGGVHFRVWAPKRKAVEVVFESGTQSVRLIAEPGGYFSGHSPAARAGDRYRFKLDDDELLYPDPASRFQPDGPHGPSQVIDPDAFSWSDESWKGIAAADRILYELHIGTFTKEGTWAAAMAKLPELLEIGISCLEIMPVADFAGTFGWGYDGVNMFAPTRLYGPPDDFRRFVDRAHELGLAVILDVVYNHLGPDGNYIGAFSQDYFSTKHQTDWGQAINFDGENSSAVREFYIANAIHWIREYHLDGFRFDATQNIYDDGPRHVLAEISSAARKTGEEFAPARPIYLVNENEPQDTALVRSSDTPGGCGMDALWNDDFHHSAMVVLSGRNEAYFTDYLGKPQEFISAIKWGYLYQGQHYKWQNRRRGTPALDLPPFAFVNYTQNHDQIANYGHGLRAHYLASPGQLRAMTALLLLAPQSPMLFQGQEWSASAPFSYFADHTAELNELIRKGRLKELSQFRSIAQPEMQELIPVPGDRQTYERCKLDWAERERPFHAQALALHKDLIAIRRSEPVFRRVQRRGDLDGAVLGAHTFAIRFFGLAGDDRLLVINFDTDLYLDVMPEPLLAPPFRRGWQVKLSTEHPRYGGSGTTPLETNGEDWRLPGENWRIPGRSAVLLVPAQA